MPLDAGTAVIISQNNQQSRCCAAPEGLNFLWLETTGRCNLECVHFYADSSPRETSRGNMMLMDWLSVLDDAAHAGCRALAFIGGEPTVHPDLDAMISHAHGLGFELIEVHTNATAPTSKWLAFFKENSVSTGTSLPTPELRDMASNKPRPSVLAKRTGRAIMFVIMRTTCWHPVPEIGARDDHLVFVIDYRTK